MMTTGMALLIPTSSAPTKAKTQPSSGQNGSRSNFGLNDVNKVLSVFEVTRNSNLGNADTLQIIESFIVELGQS